MRLAAGHPTWVLGFEDEVWWSRVRQPHLHAWADDGQPVRLVEQTVAKKTKRKDAVKAVACYGLLARWHQEVVVGAPAAQEAMWLRFVDGRPISAVTIQFLAWCLEQVAALGKTALVLLWDNASWHVSREVRDWVRTYNRHVKAAGHGVRLLVCALPTKSPWLNPIEPKWVHGKRAIAEPAALLSVTDLIERICAYFGCDHHPHLTMHEEVA
jgi:transposase